ncbi:hypothetical protein KFK09_022484 [Dendrobium nobile]|uniref:Uncharacterized protein n=1 Tax=Dendrobium nobile TaxID=94219 RepID=A0A8T3AIN9_DENNO|nr:hypothetical protein KFK09_022484 [Dendrobium nobile]
MAAGMRKEISLSLWIAIRVRLSSEVVDSSRKFSVVSWMGEKKVGTVRVSAMRGGGEIGYEEGNLSLSLWIAIRVRLSSEVVDSSRRFSVVSWMGEKKVGTVRVSAMRGGGEIG